MSVSSRDAAVSAMSDQTDFRGSVPAGAMESDSEVASGLLRIAKTPSPRSAQIPGAKRARGSEKKKALHKRMQTTTSLQSQERTGEASQPKRVGSFTQGKAPVKMSSNLGGHGRNAHPGVMGAKAAAARKGAMIPASPKGKAKKKSVDEGGDADSNAGVLLSNDNTADNTATNKEDKAANNGKGDEAQKDHDQDQEHDSILGRKANTPKIIDQHLGSIQGTPLHATHFSNEICNVHVTVLAV
eukprot:6174023-Pleurochrysis_carterae.AAC.5